MTGLDQDMMQKNLTCKTLGDAQKNIFWFCVVLVFVNILFLSLGVSLYIYADEMSIALPQRTDDLFPMLAIQHFSVLGGALFLLGITAAAYSSADSALTSLTTSFCVDFLGYRQEDEGKFGKVRKKVHLGFSVVLFAVVLIFRAINDQSVINAVFTAAGYTYGPLLGLFTFGMFTKWQVKDKYVLPICLASPLLSYIINVNSVDWLFGYKFGFELLILNGLLTFSGLWLIRMRSTT